MKQHSPGAIKVTLPSATQFPAIAYKRGISDRVYASPSEFLWDVVEILKAEVRALVDDGVAYVQIDAPRYSYYMDPKWRDWIRTEMGQDPDAALDEAIRADNACLEGPQRPGVTLAIHLCRGNNRSHWYAQGGYDPIAEKLFTELRVDRFLLEYDDERSGTFEPLRFVPRGKTVVLGLVSSKLREIGVARRAAGTHRGGRATRPARPPRAFSPVRLRVDDGGEPASRRPTSGPSSAWSSGSRGRSGADGAGPAATARRPGRAKLARRSSGVGRGLHTRRPSVRPWRGEPHRRPRNPQNSGRRP